MMVRPRTRGEAVDEAADGVEEATDCRVAGNGVWTSPHFNKPASITPPKEKTDACGQDRQVLASAQTPTSEALRNNLPEFLIDLADQNERTSDNARHINFPQQGPRHTFV